MKMESGKWKMKGENASVFGDKLMFVGVFAVTLQGLSKNGRGSREAGGEVAPFYVAKWRVAVHWYKFRNLIRRLRRHLLPFLEKALYARRFVTSNPPINQI